MYVLEGALGLYTYICNMYIYIGVFIFYYGTWSYTYIHCDRRNAYIILFYILSLLLLFGFSYFTGHRRYVTRPYDYNVYIYMYMSL